MLHQRNRLGRSPALSYVIRRGRITRTKGFLIRTAQTRHPSIRFAVSISQKVEKKAVNRNRVRRQLYGLLKTHLLEFRSGIDCSISVQREAFGFSRQERADAFLHALTRARIFSHIS